MVYILPLILPHLIVWQFDWQFSETIEIRGKLLHMVYMLVKMYMRAKFEGNRRDVL